MRDTAAAVLADRANSSVIERALARMILVLFSAWLLERTRNRSLAAKLREARGRP
jgi:hypothetical protein